MRDVPVDLSDPGRRTQAGYRARFEWGAEGIRSLIEPGDVVVVVDVFVFSTNVSILVERGAAAVPEPRRERDGAGAAPEPVYPAALLDVEAAAEVGIPSGNGATCVLLAAAAGATVLAGALRNAAAVGRHAAAIGRPVSVIAAGERWWSNGTMRPAFEDLVAAGAVLAACDGVGLSPEARAVVGAFEAVRNELGKLLPDSTSGRAMVERGHARDVELAAQLNVTELVPVFDGRRFRAERAPSA